jgi:hypothetical protein
MTQTFLVMPMRNGIVDLLICSTSNYNLYLKTMGTFVNSIEICFDDYRLKHKSNI